MIAGGLQRLDAQDCERWRLCCKNQLTSACGKHLLGSRNKRKHISGAKDNGSEAICMRLNKLKKNYLESFSELKKNMLYLVLT